ncbi:hypothetical protein Tco_0716989 [Tanacetum coccineum]
MYVHDPSLVYSPGPSNLQAILQDLQYPKAILQTFKKCRVLKLQALAWKDNGTRGNSENVYASGTTHTKSATLLHEVYSDMGKLRLE